MAGISINNMAEEIASLMEQYAADIAESMKAEAKEVAKDAAQELKQTSPTGAGSRKGHYKDGWTAKVNSENATSINITVHNRKKPGLTHLLEKGHAKRGGGRVSARPHIANAEQHAIDDYEKRLKARLSR